MLKLKKISHYSSMLFDPVFLTRYRLHIALKNVLTAVIDDDLHCLDVGCGDRPYESFFAPAHYVGVDVQNSGRPLTMKQPDQFYDGKTLPYADASFGLVMSTQVLEHVPDPLALLTEMARVCKRGGYVIVSLPFVYQEHEEPFDYFRFTGFGIASLLQRAGLQVVTVNKDSTAVDAIAVLVNTYVMSSLVPPVRGLGRLLALLFCFPVQLLAMVLAKALPNGGQLYLNLVVLARKP